jgi:hypothetical protein
MVVVQMMHVIRGRKKKVPTVSIATLGLSIRGKAHKGTWCCPRMLSQAMAPLTTKLTNAVPNSAL